MKRVMVRYTVKAERAAENEGDIKQVFAELARFAPAGVQYSAFKLEDGATFVHVYAHEGDDTAGLLPTFQAFQAFRAGLNERCEVAPVRTALHEVGSYAAGYAGMKG